MRDGLALQLGLGEGLLGEAGLVGRVDGESLDPHNGLHPVPHRLHRHNWVRHRQHRIHPWHDRRLDPAGLTGDLAALGTLCLQLGLGLSGLALVGLIDQIGVELLFFGAEVVAVDDLLGLVVQCLH